MDTRTASDATLWARARDGDGRAFAVLFRAHADGLLSHAWRVVGTRSDAEDAVAMAFLEMWRRRDRVRVVDGSVRAWLVVTVTNLGRNIARSRRRYARLLATLPPPEPAEEDAAEAVWRDIDGRQLGSRAREAFVSLSESDQQILQLTLFDGLSPTAVAEVLGISGDAAKQRAHRARVRLRARFHAADPDTAARQPPTPSARKAGPMTGGPQR